MKKIYLTLSLLSLPFLASAHYEGDFFGHHHMNMGFGFFGGAVFVFLFWILVALGVIYLIKYLVGTGKDSERKADRAVEILKERYAKGEISKEEYEQKKKELQ